MTCWPLRVCLKRAAELFSQSVTWCSDIDGCSDREIRFFCLAVEFSLPSVEEKLLFKHLALNEPSKSFDYSLP